VNNAATAQMVVESGHARAEGPRYVVFSRGRRTMSDAGTAQMVVESGHARAEGPRYVVEMGSVRRNVAVRGYPNG